MIDLGIDKKGYKFTIDLEENRNICIVGNVPSDLAALAKKIEEQSGEPSQWIKSRDITTSDVNKQGLIIIDGTDGLESIETLNKLIDSNVKTIIVTEKFDEEVIPESILQNIDLFFVGWIRSIPNYATQRLKLEKSTMYLDFGEFITSKENHKERKIQIDV